MVEPRGAIARKLVLTVSTLVGLVGLYWITRGFVVDGRLRLGNPVGQDLDVSSGAAQPEAPLRVRAEVTRVVEGNLVRVGDKCELLIERHTRKGQSYYCKAQVVCGGRLAYGGQDRGYFPCIFSVEHQDVVGSDPSTTRDDHDPAFQIDTRAGVMRVWDDASGEQGTFSLEAEVLSVQ